MSLRTDNDLLRDYAGNGSELAFSELVKRHVALVYSKSQLAELLRLRGEVGLLQRDSQELARLRAPQRAEKGVPQPDATDPARDFLPSRAWANVGAGKPEASIQTFFWAAKDGPIFLNGLNERDGG